MRSAPKVHPLLNISNLPDNDYYEVDTVAFATFCYSIQKIPSSNRKLYRQPIYYNCSNYTRDQCIYNNHNTNTKLKLNFNFFNHALTTITICNTTTFHAISSYYDKPSCNQSIYYNILYIISICRLFILSINLLKEYVSACKPDRSSEA